MTTAVSRALRVDDSTWRRLSATATPAGAGLIVLGTYLVFAFDRFGMQGFFEPRATVRVMLTGLYGWLWLVGATWLIIRFVFGYAGPVVSLVPLFGHAHLPLLLVAVFIQLVSVTLDFTSVARWVALFAGVLWMPAMLGAAARNVGGLTLGQSMVAAAIPYLVWALVVGRTQWTQLGHLL